MNLVDILVLSIVIIFIALIIFLRYILPHIGKNKKKKRSNSCTYCPIGEDMKAKRFLKEYHKANKK